MSMIGEIIKQRRKAKKITQLDLANSIGVDRTTINKYENGKRKIIPFIHLVKIIRALDISIWDLPQEEFRANYHLRTINTFDGTKFEEIKENLPPTPKTLNELISQFEPEVTISGKAKDKYIIIRKSLFTPEQITQIENFIAFLRSQNNKGI